MKKWTHIVLITLVFIAFIFVVMMRFINSNVGYPISVRVLFDDEVRDISVWDKSADGRHYVFLPSGTDIEDAMVVLNTTNPVLINDVRVSDGMSCDNFALDTSYKLSFTSWGREYQHELVFVKSDGVATMFVDTQSGDSSYINSDKENKEPGMLFLVDVDGTANYMGEISSIRGRGNTTWRISDKKPYNITLAKEGNLLGMGMAQEWVLLANAMDTSNLRNKIVHDFANDVGLNYSPQCRWVDVYLNDEYIGLYLLSEKNEAHTSRVDVVDSSSSFLVSMEPQSRLEKKGDPYIITGSEQYLGVYYPQSPNSDTLTEISNVWQSVENAILAQDGIDPITGKSWLELIDLDSWVKKYLIEETFGNIDAGKYSQYFYFDGNGSKVYAGPVWDYDYSMGRPGLWSLSSPQAICIGCFQLTDAANSPWYYNLYQKEEFRARVAEIYQQQFLPVLKTIYNEGLDSYSTQISAADRVNRIRWSVTTEAESDMEYIRDYMLSRIDFLNNLWVEGQEYCFVRLDRKNGGHQAYIAVKYGDMLFDETFQNYQSDGFIGWCYAGTNEPFSETSGITENIELYAKWKPTASDDTGAIDSFSSMLGLLLICFFVFVGASVVVVAIIRIKRERVTTNDRK